MRKRGLYLPFKSSCLVCAYPTSLSSPFSPSSCYPSSSPLNPFSPFHSTFPIPLSFSPITLALPFCLVLPLSLFLFLPLPPFPPYHLLSLSSPSSSFILPLFTPSPLLLPSRGLSSLLCTLHFSRQGDSHFRVLPTSPHPIGGEQDARL